LRRRTRVDQSADRHVAADPAKGIEMADTHGVIMGDSMRRLQIPNVFSLYQGGEEMPISLVKASTEEC
jgi:hypothetical protein